MSNNSLFRRFRRRIRAITSWHWFLLFLVFVGISHSLERHRSEISASERQLRYEVVSKCQDMTEEKLGYKTRIGFRKFGGYEPTQNRNNFWSYDVLIEDPDGNVIGFLHCIFQEPSLDVHRILAEGSQPSVEVFDFREAKRITYSDKRKAYGKDPYGD